MNPFNIARLARGSSSRGSRGAFYLTVATAGFRIIRRVMSTRQRTLLRFVDICPFVCHVCDMRFYLFVATSSFRRPEAIQAWDDAQRSKSILSSN